MDLRKIGDIISRLFSKEGVSNILFSDMENAELEKWYYINEGTIRYKFKYIAEDVIVSITEWLEDDVFNLHQHTDCDETIFVIRGNLKSELDNLSRTIYQKLYYSAGIVHKIHGTKGTFISVKFDKIPKE